MKSTDWGALYIRISQIRWTRSSRLSHSSKCHLWVLMPAMWHLSLTFIRLTQGFKEEINFLSFLSFLAQETVSSLLFNILFFFFPCRQDFWLMAHGDGISHKLFPVFQITSQAGASRSTTQPGGVQGRWEPSAGNCQIGIKPARNCLSSQASLLLLLFSLKEGHYFKVFVYCLPWVFPGQHIKHVFTCPVFSTNLIISS